MGIRREYYSYLEGLRMGLGRSLYLSLVLKDKDDFSRWSFLEVYFMLREEDKKMY